MIGRARPELRPDLRSFPFGAYLILYRAIDDGAEIVRVVHAARNLDDLVLCAPTGPAAANLDQMGKIPEFKFCAAKVEPAREMLTAAE